MKQPGWPRQWQQILAADFKVGPELLCSILVITLHGMGFIHDLRFLSIIMKLHDIGFNIS
jgi:hypothetical protein